MNACTSHMSHITQSQSHVTHTTYNTTWKIQMHQNAQHYMALHCIIGTMLLANQCLYGTAIQYIQKYKVRKTRSNTEYPTSNLVHDTRKHEYKMLCILDLWVSVVKTHVTWWLMTHDSDSHNIQLTDNTQPHLYLLS